MNVMIRKAQLHDVPDIFIMNNELNGAGWSTVESMKQSLRKNQNELIFVAVYNDKAIGFICGQLYSSICYAGSYQCEITELFVSKEYRRKGVAAMLVHHLELEFTQNNVCEIIVKTGRNNFNAQKLYEKCGYIYKRMAYLKEV